MLILLLLIGICVLCRLTWIKIWFVCGAAGIFAYNIDSTLGKPIVIVILIAQVRVALSFTISKSSKTPFIVLRVDRHQTIVITYPNSFRSSINPNQSLLYINTWMDKTCIYDKLRQEWQVAVHIVSSTRHSGRNITSTLMTFPICGVDIAASEIGSLCGILVYLHRPITQSCRSCANIICAVCATRENAIAWCRVFLFILTFRSQ